MGYDLRLPNIKGATEKERLTQVESYLRQLVEQLQWAMNSLEAVSASGVNNITQTTSKGSSQALEKAVDANATFNAIKHLIIKSADIVASYYDEINKKLVGEYVAISDFGTFREETEQNIIANSQGIEQTFSNIQTIESDAATINNALRESIDDNAREVESVNATLSGKIDSVSEQATSDIERIESGLGEDIGGLRGTVDEIDKYVVDVKAHINAGLLDTVNGIPIYGIEVGQKINQNGVMVYEKFARFTSSRLSFYDSNAVEVAYISDRQLYISNIQVLYSYKIGGILDTVLPNGDVVTKWVGIGGGN